MPDDPREAQRARFEAAMGAHPHTYSLVRCSPDPERDGAVYLYDHTEHAWQGYQAAERAMLDLCLDAVCTLRSRKGLAESHAFILGEAMVALRALLPDATAEKGVQE